MAKYRQKVPTLEAVQYDPGADAPSGVNTDVLDIIQRWGLNPDDVDDVCDKPWIQHAWLGNLVDGRMLCPGDYIVNGTDPAAKADFEARWELMP